MMNKDITEENLNSSIFYDLQITKIAENIEKVSWHDTRHLLRNVKKKNVAIVIVRAAFP